MIDPVLTRVSVAIVPIDASTGRIVPRGIEARVADSPARPVRNLSGALVFTDLEPQPLYRIQVSARAARYFDPAPFDFVPPPANVTDPDKRRVVVPLFPRPSAGSDSDYTSVAGLVVRGNRSAAGATIAARVASQPQLSGAPPEPPEAFRTLADERGTFVLCFSVPDSKPSDDANVKVEFTFTHGADKRTFNAHVTARKFHSFKKPIDLTSNDIPQLVPSGA